MVTENWIDIENNLGRFLGIEKHCMEKITKLVFFNYDCWFSYNKLIMVQDKIHGNGRKLLTKHHIDSNTTSKHAQYMCGKDRKTRLMLLDNETYHFLNIN